MALPNGQKHKVICMWSGPRNLSTAMMRSFENRVDTVVWDEPFFAPWLFATGKDHPGRKETLERHEINPTKIAQECLVAPSGGESFYLQKHMPHHMENDFPLEWTKHCQHFFLLRRPDAVIASYAKGRTEFVIEDIGFLQQIKLYDKLVAEGHNVPIIDSDDILANPEAMLIALCKTLNMPFDPAMLNWPAGPRDTDGAWAPYWYKSVESSTGFTGRRQEPPVVPKLYQEMAEQCRPAYDALLALSIKH